jgi:ATP-binding cassette subfamily C protein CydC
MSVWSYLRKLYQPKGGWLLLAFLSLTITWLSAAALLAISGWFITACAMAGLGLVANLNIFSPSAYIRALAILRTVGRYTERVIGHEAILRILADLRVRAFAALANRPAKQVDPYRHTDLVNRLTADVDTLDGVPLRVIGPLLAAVLTWITVVLIGWFWGGASIALVIGAGGALTFAAALWCAWTGHAQGRAVIEARTTQRVALTDHLGGLADLLAYNQTQQSDRLLQTLTQAQTQRLIKQERYASVSEHAVQALTALMTLSVLAMAWPTLDAPVVTLLALMTLGMNEALGSLPGAFWRIGEATQAGRRLMDLEATQTSAINAEQLAPVGSPSVGTHRDGAISLQMLVCERQPSDAHALSLQIVRGQPLVVFGPSGAGKTSLLSTLAGELAPVSGEVWMGEVDLLKLQDGIRYQHVGFLSQNDQLLDLSIRSFLSLGLTNVEQPALREVLHAVDLLETLEQTPEGFDYRLGVGGSRISGGQARRLQLAALLLRDPELVLLDEPFRGLQPALVQTILDRISPWLLARSCVIVTHDPQALPQDWPRMAWPSR